MMVIMQETATEAEVAHIVARIEEIGASAHISSGERVTIIGVIGDREEITQLPLEAMPGVDRVVAILRPYKLVSREFQQRDTLIDLPGARNSRLTSLYGRRMATTRSTPGIASSGSCVISSRSPMTPMIVTRSPEEMWALAPISSIRATMLSYTHLTLPTKRIV